MARGNKANRDAFLSIEAEAKELLRHLHPALQRMNKIDRMDGAGAEMRRAAYAIIREFHIAYFCKDARDEHIRQMIGWYGHLQAALEISCQQGILAEGFKLPIAMRMERIEEGIRKWYNSRHTQRQARDQCTRPEADGGGPAGDYE